MAPLCQKFQIEESFKTIVCVTAQHREMMDQVLEVFDLKPDIDLNIMKKDQDLFDVTSIILLKMKKWFLRDDKWYSKINYVVFREDFLSLQSLRSGRILFENKQELDRAIIEAVKTSK